MTRSHFLRGLIVKGGGGPGTLQRAWDATTPPATVPPDAVLAQEAKDQGRGLLLDVDAVDVERDDRAVERPARVRVAFEGDGLVALPGEAGLEVERGRRSARRVGPHCIEDDVRVVDELRRGPLAVAVAVL